MPSLGRMWWLLQRDLKRGPSASYHFWRTLPKVPSQLRTWGDLPQASVPVHILSGKEHLPLTYWMLASFSAATGHRWQVVLHEDGSFDAEDFAQVAEVLEGATVIRRAEADEKMNGLLKAYPNCLAYRDRHPLALKCFDVPAYCSADRFLLLDSDVLFFERATEILDWCADANDMSCWFNEDPQEPSPVLPEDAPRVFGSPLWPRVNSGLCLLNRKATRDLAFFERCLKAPELADADPWRIEQMLLALAASRTESGGLLPKSYEVSLGKKRADGAVARHYVGKVRNHFYGEGLAALAASLNAPR